MTITFAMWSGAVDIVIITEEFSAVDALTIGSINEPSEPASALQWADLLATSVLRNPSRAMDAFQWLAAIEDASTSAHNKFEKIFLATCWYPEEFKRRLRKLGHDNERSELVISCGPDNTMIGLDHVCKNQESGAR